MGNEKQLLAVGGILYLECGSLKFLEVLKDWIEKQKAAFLEVKLNFERGRGLSNLIMSKKLIIVLSIVVMVFILIFGIGGKMYMDNQANQNKVKQEFVEKNYLS